MFIQIYISKLIYVTIQESQKFNKKIGLKTGGRVRCHLSAFTHLMQLARLPWLRGWHRAIVHAKLLFF